MKRIHEEKLKKSLDQTLERWWDGAAQATGVPLPYVGEDTIDLMARAALAVLLGIAGAQEYLIQGGMLKED